jgi:hypothetical protein
MFSELALTRLSGAVGRRVPLVANPLSFGFF